MCVHNLYDFISNPFSESLIESLHLSTPLLSTECYTYMAIDFGIPNVQISMTANESDAAIFRFKECPHSLDSWRKQLEIGSDVVVVCARPGDHSGSWVEGHVIGFRDNGFGTEINVIYRGICAEAYDWDDNHAPERVSGTVWIPIESNRICRRDCDDTSHRHKIWTESDFIVWTPWEADRILEKYEAFWKCEIGDVMSDIDDPNCDRMDSHKGDKFDRKVKYRVKRWRKKRKNGISKNWNSKNDKKRMERKSRKYGKIPRQWRGSRQEQRLADEYESWWICIYDEYDDGITEDKDFFGWTSTMFRALYDLKLNDKKRMEMKSKKYAHRVHIHC